VNAAAARIRYSIARDQFDFDLERHFKLAHFGLAADLRFPSVRMEFWDGIMRKMLANGWAKRAR